VTEPEEKSEETPDAGSAPAAAAESSMEEVD